MKKSILTLTLILATAFAQAAPLVFEKADANKDGALSKEEWMAAQKVANPKSDEKAHASWFKNNDKDKDGKVTLQEFNARKEAQAKAKAKEKANKTK